MEIRVNDKFELELSKVYNSIKLISDDGEVLYICMRDNGFDVAYLENEKADKHYIQLNAGKITHIS